MVLLRRCAHRASQDECKRAAALGDRGCGLSWWRVGRLGWRGVVTGVDGRADNSGSGVLGLGVRGEPSLRPERFIPGQAPAKLEGMKTEVFGCGFALITVASLWLSSCTHRRTFSTEMEWYDDRDLRRDVLMGQTADAACLKYVDAPHFYECLFAPGMRQRLREFEKEKVRVEFEVTCGTGGLVSYRIIAVDGRDVGILQNAISGEMDSPRGEFPFFGACG